MNKSGIQSQLRQQVKLLEQLQADQNLPHKLETAVDWLCWALENNRPVLICGNGGSAADALHIAGELVATFLQQRKALNVICLNANVSVLTAWANDVNYDSTFARQVQAHGQPGGICWGISTSGNSGNVVQALQEAQKLEMKTLALTGQGGGKLAAWADLLIDVPSRSTPRIQELHLPIYHYLCEQVEARFAALQIDGTN
jgi:D-sedoheptulose 7-phosphate isomerase